MSSVSCGVNVLRKQYLVSDLHGVKWFYNSVQSCCCYSIKSMKAKHSTASGSKNITFNNHCLPSANISSTGGQNHLSVMYPSRFSHKISAVLVQKSLLKSKMVISQPSVTDLDELVSLLWVLCYTGLVSSVSVRRINGSACKNHFHIWKKFQEQTYRHSLLVYELKIEKA